MFRLAKLNRNLRPGEDLPPVSQNMSIFPPKLGRFSLFKASAAPGAYMDNRVGVYKDAKGEIALVMLDASELEWGVYVGDFRLNDADRSLNRDDIKAVLNAAQELMR